MNQKTAMGRFWQSIIHASLGYAEKADMRAVPLPADAPWAFYQQASYVALLCWAHDQGAVRLPDMRYESAANQVTVEEMRQKARHDVLAEFLGWSDGAGIPVMPLKGAELAFSIWPQSRLRMMGDLDLLVAESDVNAVMGWLQRNGFSPRSNLPADFYMHHHHKMPMQRPGDGVLIEIHTRPLSANVPEALSRGFNVERIWEDAVPGNLVGQPCMLMEPTAYWFYILMHGINDLKLFGGLFPVLDLMLLLRSSSRQPNQEGLGAILAAYPRIAYLASQFFDVAQKLGGRAFAEWLVLEGWPRGKSGLLARGQRGGGVG